MASGQGAYVFVCVWWAGDSGQGFVICGLVYVCLHVLIEDVSCTTCMRWKDEFDP